MGLIAVFKAGMVGGFGFIIAIGLVMALLIPTVQAVRDAAIKVKIIPSLIVMILVAAFGAGLAYWYLTSGIQVSSPSELEKFTTYICLFSLTPSIAIVAGALCYYCDAKKILQNKNLE